MNNFRFISAAARPTIANMPMIPPDCAAVSRPHTTPSASALERILRMLSVATMLMTVPQVLTIWIGRDAGGVSLASWAAYLLSACLWFVYGLQKGDKTIYLACIGWVALDAAIVIGIIVHS
jgi:uncharacterized protein with PQ loop repeat